MKIFRNVSFVIGSM